MHIYLHVPFCARRCAYCDFAIAVRARAPDVSYLRAIETEWARRRRDDAWPDPMRADTIYLGGGTPSRLAPDTIAALIDLVRGDSPREDHEITLEANPDDVTAVAAEGWRTAGVNRVSLGVQSHDPSVLTWMHRTHRAEQVAPSVAALRAAGIDNISIDLIFALPSALRRNWTDDLARTIDLAPRHLSIYGLTIEPATPLARWVARGEASAAPDSRYADEYLEADATLRAAGFEHYEVSNFARPGHRSRHNAGYWSGADYVGLGPSAHSLWRGWRSWNIRDWADYQRRLVAGSAVVQGVEEVSGSARELERLYLGLRTDDGIAEDLVPAGALDQWLRAGWATRDGRGVRLSAEGWLRLDALVARAADS